MVFFFSRIHSDIINTQLRDFSFPLECAFRGQQEHGRWSRSSSQSFASPPSGVWPSGHRPRYARVAAPSPGPSVSRQVGCGWPVLPPSPCQQLCLSLPGFAVQQRHGSAHRRRDLPRQTRSQPVTTKSSRVSFSVECGTGGVLCHHSWLLGGVKKGYEQSM